MTSLRAASFLAAASALSWLVPAQTWPGGYAPDLVLVLTVMLAASAPLERLAVPIIVVGWIDDCFTGGTFGARALSLFVVAVVVGVLVRHMHPGTLWVRLVLLSGAALASPIFVGALEPLPVRLHAPLASVVVTSLTGFLLWGRVLSTPPRSVPW